jgi:circadian clock protein KaiB
LKLYVTGASPRTERAIANLRHICESELAGRYTLAIVDVLEDPEAAERDRVLATPTLIKELPLPLRRVIGDLSDRAKVLLALEVRPVGLHVSPESRGGGRRRGDPAPPVRSEGRVGVAAPSRPE